MEGSYLINQNATKFINLGMVKINDNRKETNTEHKSNDNTAPGNVFTISIINCIRLRI